MRLLILVYLVVLCKCSFAQQKLGTYKILKDSITASGCSSGGSMASQLHVAYSKTFSGVGIVTGPPYYCAATGGTNNALTTCMYLSGSTINVDGSASTLSSYVSKGQADDTSNMKNDKVYIYHGTMDYTVTEGVVKRNEDFYKKYISSSQFKTVYNIASSHGFITNNYGAGCNILSSPNYINNCNYNQAYDMLKHLYNLQNPEPAKNSAFKESLIEFDQKEFFGSSAISMDDTGYIYIPKQCSSGKACKLHISLHGCLQGKYNIKDVFAANAGYNQVADENDIIVIYPQAKATATINPNGCWDWWGYLNANYANQDGPQMKAIKAMVDRITANGLVDEEGGTTIIDNGNNNSTSPCFKGPRKSRKDL